MMNKMQGSHLFVNMLMIFLFVHFVCHSTNGRIEVENLKQMLSLVSIGVVQDLNSPFDAMINLCIEMAISDFYLGHPNYTTRLRLHTKHAQSRLDVDLAVLDLLEHAHVLGVLGPPQQSTEDTFVAEIGNKVHIPIISFTARTSTLSSTQNHYYVRTTIDDADQMRALTAICHRFEWTEIVLLYEDRESSYQFLSHLNKAFQEEEIGLTHLISIPTLVKNNHIFKELSILNTKQTRVFLVHMNPSLCFQLFNLAEKIGMMSEGYAWIITDSVSNFLNSIDLTSRDSMDGVIGIRPYVPPSKDLEIFQERWRINAMNLKKNKGSIMDLNVYGLWAYDTITALAIAVEKIGPVKSSSLYVSGTKVANLRISSYGPRLLRELSSKTRFRGLSGDFQLVDGKLKPSAFEIFNLFGTGEKRVGFWSPERGIIRELSSSTAEELKRIVWPGDSVKKPKGWAIPATGTLRVGVPWKAGYNEFVNVSVDSKTNQTKPTGFVIDIFLAALRALPFHINPEFYCYNNTKNVNWTYDDMLHKIPKDYDMVVGDTTIWAPRATYVDFSLPYSESGVVLVVKNERSFDMWSFTKPLRWDLWLAIALACIFMGMVIFILERREANPAPAPPPEQKMTYLIPITVLAFQERNIVTNKWSLFVIVCWLFMAFVLMQSFTANLSAILTVDQLKFAFSKDHYIGYHEASFMKKFLMETLHINETRLRGYSSVEGFHDAMSRGSKKGGVDAIFDEIPYMKLLVNQYYPQYKITPPTYRTDGLGFAFPIGSPLTSYFSRAILNVTQGPDMISIERKYFGPGYSSQDPLSNTLSQGTSSLTFHEFAGLFIILGSLTTFALICAETALVRTLKTITGRFVNKFLLRTNRGGINVDEDARKGKDDADGAPVGEDRGERSNGQLELLQDRGEEIVELTLNNEANDVQDAEGETHNHPDRTL